MAIYNKENYELAKQLLLQINYAIKEFIPQNQEKDFDTAGYHEVSVAYIDGEAVERIILILRGCGCEWAYRDFGGCTMCGHLTGSTKGKTVPKAQLKKQFDEAMNATDFSKYPMLCLYNGGSFLNEVEIPVDLRRYMYKQIESIPHIKRLIIESRPEYITAELLDEIEELMPTTTVEIGVGFETANDIIRDLVLNKGVTSDELKAMGKLFKGRRTKLLAYVLVNPPFLTESEAILDTVNAIEFAHECGADIVSLEAVSIQHLTLVSFMAEAGFYKTPWIWSMFEIVKQTNHLGLDMRIGGFEFFPIPKEFTSNCSACDEEMIQKIQEFNHTNDLSVIEDLSCKNKCDLQWKEDLAKKDPRELCERIIYTLENINLLEILERLQQNTPDMNEVNVDMAEPSAIERRHKPC